MPSLPLALVFSGTRNPALALLGVQFHPGARVSRAWLDHVFLDEVRR